LSAGSLYYYLEARFRDLTFALTPLEREYLEQRTGVLLASPVWQQRNFGVKLTGLLGMRERLPVLLALFNDRRRVPWWERLLGGDFQQRGFIRRNLIHAFQQFQEYDPRMEAAFTEGLRDPYYEVVSRTLTAITQYAEHLDRQHFYPRILELLKHRNFEIVTQAVVACGRWLDDENDLHHLYKLFTHPNPRVRQAVVAALQEVVRRGRVTNPRALKDKLGEMLLTTTYFRPHFPLKQGLRELVQQLREHQ
jgi:UDP-N-acetylglucosamine--N-acetylmuramyl-(pentapeptide) pyrophosphoryl-undecaprenol N-acetylglucosamine transferase